jgi:DNA-directed RNA polymerase III subunit RPC4
MDAIIADDELFFIQLPSSLPIDMDALRHYKNETAFQSVLNKMKVVRDDPSLTQDEKNSQLRELRVKLGQIKQEDTAREEKKTVISSSIDQDENIWTVPFANTLTELKSGFVGTMQVYKSGKVKLKLGDILFDVSPGTEFGFQEQVVHIDKDKKVCHTLGDIKAHLTCTPDIEYLLSKNKH